MQADNEDAGNGSLMRNAPVPIWGHADEAMGMEVARRQSYTTHPGPMAAEACAFLTFVCTRAINMAGEGKDSGETVGEVAGAGQVGGRAGTKDPVAFLDATTDEYLGILADLIAKEEKAEADGAGGASGVGGGAGGTGGEGGGESSRSCANSQCSRQVGSDKKYCSAHSHLEPDPVYQPPPPVSAGRTGCVLSDTLAKAARRMDARRQMVRLLQSVEPDSSTERCWNWKSDTLEIAATLRNRGRRYNGYPVNAGMVHSIRWSWVISITQPIWILNFIFLRARSFSRCISHGSTLMFLLPPSSFLFPLSSFLITFFHDRR